MRYEAVDPAERRSTRARTVGLIALFAVFVVALAATAVLISPAWLQVAFAVLALAGLVWFGLFVVTQLPTVWQVDPLLVVSADGLAVRTEPFSGVGEPRRIRLAWSEIASVGYGVLAPLPPQPPDPGSFPAGAPRVYLAWQRGRLPDLRLPRAGRSAPRAVVVVGLHAGSVGQDAEFRRRWAELRDTLRWMRADRRQAQLEGTDPLVEALVVWQQEWTAQPRPVGVLLAVPDRAVDPERLDTALRAAGLGSGLRLLETAAHTVLDTPHDLVRRLRSELPYRPTS